jgi:hypothetical protein
LGKFKGEEIDIMTNSLKYKANYSSDLPAIQSHLWQRYYFESKDRYYIVILQQDLFHEWSILNVMGER